MPCTVFKCKIPEIDKVFAASKFTYLDHLNISEAPISTLCWLYNAPNIRVLDLSGCSLLVDEDFQVFVDCFNLEQLYLSFTNITYVSNFFYKRKLSTYTLTAHSSKDGCAYNCIWHEAISGRGANDIASAVVTILKHIKRAHHEIASFILWSDACVPQNKNSVMSFALKRFMKDCNIESIVQKFGCPGHSSVQEVDNIHSNIERITRYAEIYSPIALIRDLKSMRRSSVRIIQMQKHNFMDYQKCIMPLKFNEIPFTKVKCLKYDKCLPFHIGYKLSYSATDFRTAHIEIRQTGARTNKQPEFLPRPAQSNKVPIISQDKKKDITCMLKYMPEVDRQFYKALKLVINE
ncbi:uncharacterized protein LOC123527441 [Mercenaria mercenaria]|uniref:uncharacterized protein LOC123527441 n=1 Tax=Mercenaria mercenaria TaxID=6596 RepID=UPI001E1DD88F|nr:uncharacterized protein LOC123527441 [Mercenaria mercenaria]